MHCQVCGGAEGKEHLLREMMFGTRQEFTYWECRGCGCLQIVQVPLNTSEYYPENFYSFSLRLSSWKTWYYRLYFAFPEVMRRIHRCGPDLDSVVRANPRARARILDVGCGSGKLVDILRALGFDAWGIDPFLKEKRPYLEAKSIEDVEGGWDLIMFHHVLEHMPDNIQVLRFARARLSSGGVCLVRIPVANWAWEHYGRNWVQLDPPRHVVIHTPGSFRRASKEAGFRTMCASFDSTEFQMWGSELYRQDVPLQTPGARDLFSKQELSRFRLRAEELNRLQRGDQAAFILTPE